MYKGVRKVIRERLDFRYREYEESNKKGGKEKERRRERKKGIKGRRATIRKDESEGKE